MFDSNTAIDSIRRLHTRIPFPAAEMDNANKWLEELHFVVSMAVAYWQQFKKAGICSHSI
jgi:hypothetical protein